MKKILFALILCLPLSFFAQTLNSKEKTTKYRTTKVVPTIYAEIILTTLSPEKQKVTISFGSDNIKELKYSKAAQQEYKSLIDAMNALAKEGYKFVNTYVIDGKEATITHFIMVKEGNLPPMPPKPTKITNTKTRSKK